MKRTVVGIIIVLCLSVAAQAAPFPIAPRAGLTF